MWARRALARREWGRPDLGGQHASEMARCVAQPVGQTWYSLAIHDAVTDQPHRRAHRVGSQVPFRRARGGVGQAATAGPEAGRLGRGRSGIEVDISAQRCPGRTGRPAVDTGGADGGEELPVESGISGLHGPVGRFGISYHNNDSAISPDPALADFGHGSDRSGHPNPPAGINFSGGGEIVYSCPACPKTYKLTPAGAASGPNGCRVASSDGMTDVPDPTRSAAPTSPSTLWEQQVVGDRWTFYAERFDKMIADGTDLEGEARFVDAMAAGDRPCWTPAAAPDASLAPWSGWATGPSAWTRTPG